MYKVFSVFLAAVIGLFLIGCTSPVLKGKTTNDKSLRPPVDTVVSQLINAGLFNITDSAFLDSAKNCLADFYEKYDYFGGYMYPDSLRYVDYRFYFIDTEKLFETGGLTEYLDELNPSFEKLGLELSYSNEKSVEGENFWKHTIELNGKEYVAFDGKLDNYDLWNNAYLNFIRMLNDQLILQGSIEQFYPVRSDNDGIMVMLTPDQFEIVKKYYPDDDDHPKTIQNWMKSSGLE